MFKRVAGIIGWLLGILIVLLLALVVWIRVAAVQDPPDAPDSGVTALPVTQPDSGLFTIGNNWFRKSESGLYELYLEGSPFERGVVNGKLTRELVQYQEEVFNQQINQLVPSAAYRNVLKYLIGFFNRNLHDHVLPEFQQEIYGVSLAADEKFNSIASPYQRILNYHGAHDIGHALQNMSLVGCTSFATWGADSQDSSLIIGRNFDFYVGEEFARDKIVAFYRPEDGHKFMMVTFGGMTGVVSGMNDAGLTVTINAAKSDIPSVAATPVSLVAREILQYAGDIKEAYAIAERRRMFVAESFLIGSARDGKAVVIEKTPEAIDLYESSGSSIICTNHFQGRVTGSSVLNKEHMKTSASPYRYQRVAELLAEGGKNTVEKTASVLRDQRGLKGAEIGLGNEKLINQLVAHHGIIFQPEKGLVWVSTAPWQLGKFVCYDLNRIFRLEMKTNVEVYESEKTIPADSFTSTPEYRSYLKFSKFRFPFFPSRDGFHPDSVVSWNPKSYHSWMLAGDYYMEAKDYTKAAAVYRRGLQLEVATEQERQHLRDALRECKTHVE